MNIRNSSIRAGILFIVLGLALLGMSIFGNGDGEAAKYIGGLLLVCLGGRGITAQL